MIRLQTVRNTTPTYECEHGGLCPNIAHRRRISEEGAQIIRLLYPSWNPPSTDVGICAVCQASISKSRESNRGLRKQAEDEKVIPTPICSSVLMPLVVESLEAHVRQRFLEPNLHFPEDTPLCVIPEEFLQDWKEWLFRPTEFPRPDFVDTASLFCEHNLLLIDPNSTGDMDSLYVITVADWEILQGLYKTGPLVAIQRPTVEEAPPGFTHGIEVCQDCRTRRCAVTNIPALEELVDSARQQVDGLRRSGNRDPHTRTRRARSRSDHDEWRIQTRRRSVQKCERYYYLSQVEAVEEWQVPRSETKVCDQEEHDGEGNQDDGRFPFPRHSNSFLTAPRTILLSRSTKNLTFRRCSKLSS
jgi:hypothetical protein